MKKIVFTLLLFMIQSISCMAQDTAEVKKFLDNFRDFVTVMNAVEKPTEAQIAEWKTKYAEIKHDYTYKYKDVMTNPQLETYYTYQGQYRKKLGRENLKEAGAVIDSTSVVVGEAVRRGASKASGFIKGLFKKDNKKEE